MTRNYVIKSDVEKAIGVDTSSFVKIIDLTSFKSEVSKFKKDTRNRLNNFKADLDKLDITKLQTIPVNLENRNKLWKKNSVQSTNCKVNAAEKKLSSTIELIDKSKNKEENLEIKVKDFDEKILDTSVLDKNTNFDTRITEIKNKKPNWFS